MRTGENVQTQRQKQIYKSTIPTIILMGKFLRRVSLYYLYTDRIQITELRTLGHFGDEVAGSDNHATDRYQLVYIGRVQRAHISSLLSRERTYLHREKEVVMRGSSTAAKAKKLISIKDKSS